MKSCLYVNTLYLGGGGEGGVGGCGGGVGGLGEGVLHCTTLQILLPTGPWGPEFHLGKAPKM